MRRVMLEMFSGPIAAAIECSTGPQGSCRNSIGSFAALLSAGQTCPRLRTVEQGNQPKN